MYVKEEEHLDNNKCLYCRILLIARVLLNVTHLAQSISSISKQLFIEISIFMWTPYDRAINTKRPRLTQDILDEEERSLQSFDVTCWERYLKKMRH